MKKNHAVQCGLFNPRVFLTLALSSVGVLLGLLGLASSRAQSPMASGAFSAVGSMTSPRELHTATLLGDGRVLIAGGISTGMPMDEAELFDPATGTFSVLPHTMTTARYGHTATLLPSGRVLIAGGFGVNGNTAELYDPATGSFTSLPPMTATRERHTATLLPNGKVLIAGGVMGGQLTGATDTAELFDPATGSFTSLFPHTMTSARDNHTATLLPNGKVLIAGGVMGGQLTGATDTAELFDPATGTFTAIALPMISPRYYHTATLLANGKVLLAGGFTLGSGTGTSNTAELYDPAAGTFTPLPPLSSARGGHTATLLPSGKVLIAGGTIDLITTLNTAEQYDPATETFTSMLPNTMTSPRFWHTATLLPGGKVLMAAGNSGSAITNTAELFEPDSGSFTSISAMATARSGHTTTSLPSGQVLVAGGFTGTGATNKGEMFDPALGTFTALQPMTAAHWLHSATLLQDGKVLIAGGVTAGFMYTNKAELFDPTQGIFTPLSPGTMTSARGYHTATLLLSGKVLLAGGFDGTNHVNTAELFDPASGTFTALPPMTSARRSHTATLLSSGKVLIAGGFDGTNYLNTAELFDPASGSFTSISAMSTARFAHTATVLSNGNVLIAGGATSGGTANTAELFDPVSGTFTLLPNTMPNSHQGHTATLLGSGKVLLAGGYTTITLPNGTTSTTVTNTAELFDPASETFRSTGTMNSMRASAAATLLTTGTVLVSGGNTVTSGALTSTEVFDEGLGFSDARRPVLSTATDPIIQPASLVLTGIGFRGDSEASGSSFQGSATNYPLVQLMQLDGGQTLFLPSDPATNWSDTTFTSEKIGAVTPLPSGYYRATVFTNAIPSLQKIINIGLPVQLVSVTSSKTHGSAGTFDIDLPLAGSVGIECRSGGANGDYTLVFSFVSTLTSVGGASISTGAGSVSSSAIDSSDAHQYVVNVTGVTNAQTIAVTLTKVKDSTGGSSASVVGPSMGVLLGDVNASRRVDAADVSLVRQQTLQPIDGSNFREDLNASGRIDAADVSIARQQTLTSLP